MIMLVITYEKKLIYLKKNPKTSTKPNLVALESYKMKYPKVNENRFLI
jgi:hypothetical protein